MAMTELHFSLDALRRSKRSSAIDKVAYDGGKRLTTFKRSGVMSTVAKVAYEGALRLTDDRQADDLGQPLIRDYTRKQRVFSSTLFDPDGNVLDPQDFWNRVEFHHKRSDAVVARTIDWALPDELPLAENIKLAENYAKILADHYGVGVQVSVHRSRIGLPKVTLPGGISLEEFVAQDRGAENANTHAHLTLSSCAVLEDGSLGTKVVELDNYACVRKNPPDPSPLVFMRALAAGMINQVLAVHGLEYRVEHTSFAARDIDQIPTIHEGNSDLRKAINECIRDTNAIRAAEREREREPTGVTIADVLEPTDQGTVMGGPDHGKIPEEGQTTEDGVRGPDGGIKDERPTDISVPVPIAPEGMSDKELVAYFDATHAPEDGEPLSGWLAFQKARVELAIDASAAGGDLTSVGKQKTWYEETKSRITEDEARNLQARGEPGPWEVLLVRAARLVERLFRKLGLEKIAKRIDETITKLEDEARKKAEEQKKKDEENRIREIHTQELLAIHARVLAGGSDAEAALEEFTDLESRLRARVWPTVERKLQEQAGSLDISDDEINREIDLEMRRYLAECGAKAESDDLFRIWVAAKERAAAAETSGWPTGESAITPPGEPGIKPGQNPADAGAPAPADILLEDYQAAAANPTLATIAGAYKTRDRMREGVRKQMAEESGADPEPRKLEAALREKFPSWERAHTALDRLAKKNGFTLDKGARAVRPMTPAEIRARDSRGWGED